jgi:superfamily II DNA/RNA helicase
MLGRGFIEQIREIFSALPSDIQVALFSATMPPGISLFKFRNSINDKQVHERTRQNSCQK